MRIAMMQQTVDGTVHLHTKVSQQPERPLGHQSGRDDSPQNILMLGINIKFDSMI